MGKKLYVGNISFNVTDEDLKEAFAQFGEIVSATVIKDRISGRSRGFGFVEFTSADSAQKAREAMDGKSFKGRPLKIDMARDQKVDRGSM